MPSPWRRLATWLGRPGAHKWRSIVRHCGNGLESALTPVASLLAAADNPLFRRASFEASERRSDFLLVDRPGGEKYVVFARDKGISKSLYVHGTFDLEKLEKALALLHPRGFALDLLVDVGANIGSICIPAVRRGYAARALAFEPEPRNFALLCANLALNGLATRIEARNVALGAVDSGSLRFAVSHDHFGDHRVHFESALELYDESKRDTIVVPSETLDRHADELDPRSTLVWIDVQGYEGFVLAGATRAIERRIPMVVEFWPYGLRRAESYPRLREHVLGYEQFVDLAEAAPVPRPVAEIDRLYEALAPGADFTDLLLL